MKKKIALILSAALLASAAVTNVNAASDEYLYNEYSNAVIVNSGSTVVIDSATELIAQAEKNGADKIIITSAGENELNIKLSDAALAAIADKDIPVKISMSDATLIMSCDTIDEISEKTGDSFELALDSEKGIKATLASDSEPLKLDEPIVAVCISKDAKINNVTSNGASIPTAYISGNTWYMPISADVDALASYTESPEFSDAKKHWGKESIEYVASRGYFNGVEADKFKPDGKMTRAMAVTVLSRIDGATDADIVCTYSDVDHGAWFAKGINWAFVNGIVVESDTFRPDDNITRLELMQMLYRYAIKLNAGDVDPEGQKYEFIDYDTLTEEFDKEAVEFCTSNGIVNGYSVGDGSTQRLKPDGYATRAEVATMIQRFVTHITSDGFELGDIMGKYSDFITVRGDLKNLYNKLNGGETVVVSYFGGSVTDGYGSTDAANYSWRGLTFNWLKNNFLNAKLVHNNVAQGGSGSHLGAFRVNADIIDQKSDIVFVEFAINDYYSGTDSEGTVGLYYESVIRSIREKLPNCEIIAVFVTDSGKVQTYGDSEMHSTAKVQDAVCEHYGVTSIDVGRALAREMGGYNDSWGTYFKDSVHPLNAGYKVFADAIIEYLGEYLLGEPTLSYGESEAHELPAGYADERSESTVFTYVPINSTKIFDSIKGFTVSEDGVFMNCTKTKGFMYPSEEENEFTYTFEGTDLDMYLEFAGGGYYIEYSVDGGEVEKKYITNTNHPFNFLSGLEMGKHTVTYSYKGETGKGGVNSSRKIGAFMITGTK